MQSNGQSAASSARIELLGVMASGKSTLAKAFAEFGCRIVAERVETHPYLELFYENPPRYAFEKDLFFLTDYMHQAKRAADAGGISVFDTSLYSNLAFVMAGAETPAAKMALRRIGAAIEEEIGPPTLVVQITCSVPTLARRIGERGRSIEAGIPSAYLAALKGAMDEEARLLPANRLLILDGEAVDYRQPAAARAVAADILGRAGLTVPEPQLLGVTLGRSEPEQLAPRAAFR